MQPPTEPRRSQFEESADEHSVGIVREFLDFVRHSKKWWMIPILLVLLGMGVFLVASGTVAAPWLYTLF